MDDPGPDLIGTLKSIVGATTDRAKELIQKGKEEIRERSVRASSSCDLLAAASDRLAIDIAEDLKKEDFEKALLTFEAQKAVKQAKKGLGCA